MNKRWWITIIVVAVILIIIGVMKENGMLEFKWQVLTMFFAAAAGPYEFIKGLFLKDRKTEKLINKHSKIREEEKIHRKRYDEEIEIKEKRIKELDKEIEIADKRIKNIEKRKAKVEADVKELSIEEMQEEAINYFGS